MPIHKSEIVDLNDNGLLDPTWVLPIMYQGGGGDNH